MKISELVSLLESCKETYGDITVGYDSGVMTFTRDYSIENRDESYGGKTLSLEGEYN